METLNAVGGGVLAAMCFLLPTVILFGLVRLRVLLEDAIYKWHLAQHRGNEAERGRVEPRPGRAAAGKGGAAMSEESHEMSLEEIYADGGEVWWCPICGRCFVQYWTPHSRRVMLEEGDKTAIHFIKPQHRRVTEEDRLLAPFMPLLDALGDRLEGEA